MLSAIIVAAGSSQRMGFDKLLATIADKPVIAHSIAAFERTNSVSEIIIVTREDRHREIGKIVGDEKFKKVHPVVTGGNRCRPVRLGLRAGSCGERVGESASTLRDANTADLRARSDQRRLPRGIRKESAYHGRSFRGRTSWPQSRPRAERRLQFQDYLPARFTVG